jgi:hypothetical protein
MAARVSDNTGSATDDRDHVAGQNRAGERRVAL